jgi:tetratricopeptide (TPR) repeat protein
MKNRLAVLSLLSGILSFSGCSTTGTSSPNVEVKIWEESLTLPTYPLGANEILPIFHRGNAYQGATRSVYPYPFMDALTDVKESRTYNALYLENAFIKLCLLPELGGRIFSAVDKTNGYDLFYRQSVIKPCLVGMLGAWIAGGVEWNFPHHHRAATFMPVEYSLEEYPDGSKTIWIGELELRHRITWTLGLTLFPDKSYIEVTVKLFNQTPFIKSMLFWTNAATHANDDYQIFFPPRTQYATFHAKNDFTEWPISRQVYRGIDFTDGVDISRYRNYKAATSFFAWNYEDDFVAGYDHGKEAGVVHISNHQIAPGKKVWTWGKGPQGQAWEKIYTDDDGPYIEIMTGAYTDNQPDYSWFQPYEVRTFKEYWYPLRELRGVKEANIDASVNLELLPDGKVWLAMNTSTLQKDARAILKAGEQKLLDEKLTISPAAPFSREIVLPPGVSETDLRASLLSAEGQELVSYEPVTNTAAPKPSIVKPPMAPSEVESVEELCLIGQRLEQFHHPTLDPTSYYQEALRRDPGSSRAHTALGIYYCRRAMYPDAEIHLNRALERLTRDYTKPRSGETAYYLGVALQGQARYKEAVDAYYQAVWSQDFKAAAYYTLAELACLDGDYSAALELVDRSLFANQLNSNGTGLKTTILRQLGRFDEARKTAQRAVNTNPLDFWALNELSLLARAEGKGKEADRLLRVLTTRMHDSDQLYLELAIHYGDCVFYAEALEILARSTDTADADAIFPILLYYEGFYSDKNGAQEAALAKYQAAAGMPSDYCFPFRLETIDVLEQAIVRNPPDARARYYLGNLLFNIQPESKRVLLLWEESAALDESFFPVHRNLGLYYSRVENDYPRAIACYEKAIACNDQIPRLFSELDELYQAVGTPQAQRLALLEQHHAVVNQRDDALMSEIALLVWNGDYDRALQLLEEHQFHVWEGGGDIRTIYENAHLLKGLRLADMNQYRQALEHYRQSLDYPKNLQVWRLDKGIDPKVDYLIGTAYEGLDDPDKAMEYFHRSVAHQQDISELSYYQGMALRKLGRTTEANGIFKQLLQQGWDMLETEPTVDFFAKFGFQQSKSVWRAQAHYLLGLGYTGLNDTRNARVEFSRAQQLDINHLWAKSMLAEQH